MIRFRALAICLSVTSLLAAMAWAQTDRPGTEDGDPTVIAVVLGKNITAQDRGRLSGLILGALLEQFAKDEKIGPTDEELDAFIRRTEEEDRKNQIRFERDRQKLREELKSPSLDEREREKKESRLKTLESILKSTREMKEQTRGMEEEIRRMERRMARHFVQAWKINKALFARYGGRVIFQQAGPEPLDAYRDFLREHEAKKSFQLLDARYEAGFWRYFTNDAMHTFYSDAEGARSINTPWWMMDEPAEEH